MSESEGNEAVLLECKGKYLGGHSAFQNSKTIHFTLTSKCIQIPEMFLKIPLSDLTAQLVREEKLASSLIILPWKKIKKFLLVNFEDEERYEECLFLDFENVEEVDAAIHKAKANLR
jgi:hypothetical protein